MNAYCLHKKHNAEDVRLKARPVGRCPKARLRVIASYQAISMFSKQRLDPGFWASPEFMILNQSCPGATLKAKTLIFCRMRSIIWQHKDHYLFKGCKAFLTAGLYNKSV